MALRAFAARQNKHVHRFFNLSIRALPFPARKDVFKHFGNVGKSDFRIECLDQTLAAGYAGICLPFHGSLQ